MEDSPASHKIPHDLILEILPRLPAKSVIRFQSVSKLWYSTIRSKDFAKTFLTHSNTRPRLLFNFCNDDAGKEFIFSAPEQDNNNSSSSSSVLARHDMTISGFVYTIRSHPVNGFFCCIRGSSIVVCNPTTKQIVKLPDVPNGIDDAYVKLGYDPAQNQYKVLCVMTIFDTKYNREVNEHLVCTVKSGRREDWRKIETIPGNPYSDINDGICISGAIYFGVGDTKIAKFDVRSEKIHFILGPEDYNATSHGSTLVNHQGKLGRIEYNSKMHLWIMEKEECWKYVTCHQALELIDRYAGKMRTYISGEIHTGEIMLATRCFELCKPFFVFYYDFIRKSFRSVEILGLADHEFGRIHGIDKHARVMLCFPGHIENIMFL